MKVEFTSGIRTVSIVRGHSGDVGISSDGKTIIIQAKDVERLIDSLYLLNKNYYVLSDYT
jgi:hypothetical protein